MTLNVENKKISDNKFTKYKTNINKDQDLKYQDIKIDINIENYKTNNKTIDNSNNNICEKKNYNRCNYINCNKKIRISDIKCKCEFIFCSLHRLPETHECIFNYKLKDSGKIIENMKCISSKIEKI